MFELPVHLHPMVVHFPIALFITALGFDLMSLVFKRPEWHRSAVHIYILAALLTPLVLRTGIEEAERVRINHPLLDHHSRYAHWTMWTALASLPVLYLLNTWSKRYFRIVFLIFCLVVVRMVSLTADKGGKLVYNYGVGIEE
jgi:uncharacterized membrane protein